MKQRILKLLKTIVNTIRRKTQRHQKQRVVVDFSPDEIVSTEIFHGRFFLCTRHILWEVEENSDGSVQIKSIEHTG